MAAGAFSMTEGRGAHCAHFFSFRVIGDIGVILAGGREYKFVQGQWICTPRDRRSMHLL
jgi:hypothetical protein